jgi:hypothetical protein
LKQASDSFSGLFDAGVKLYVIGDTGDLYDGLRGFFDDVGISLVEIFMAPSGTVIEQHLATWKANTVKALKASLYIDKDLAAITMARALGVPVAHYLV